VWLSSRAEHHWYDFRCKTSSGVMQGTTSWPFIAFIELTKAFDTVNRDLLLQVLCKFGCPPRFLGILREFHTDMRARVVQGGELSKSFGVNTGVKQGCVLAPVIFNLFLVAVTLVFVTTSLLQMAFASSTGSMAVSLVSVVCKQWRK